jgi:lysophospholipase L1-like esterase
MPPWMYQLAGGVYFLPGTALLATGLLITAISRRRGFMLIAVLAAVLGAALVSVSATAFPWWFYGIWASVFIGWIFGRLRRVFGVLLFLCCGIAAAWDMSYQQFRPLPAGHCPALYVIGDSITAGLARPAEITWPALLRSQHGLQIVDLSRAGCSVNQAVGLVGSQPPSRGIVLIEIGGNDIIGRTKPGAFAADLDRLARLLRGSDRQLVMFELPLFPFDNAYGIAQHDVARRYQIQLIPRRCFAAILASPNATIDGIHLTAGGQRRLADLVWCMVGRAMGG